jgi:hypothetical protein
MLFKIKYLAIAVITIGIVAIVVGGVFIYQSIDKESWMKEAMRLEKITLGLSEEAIANGDIIDTPEEAQAAGDIIRGHRSNIAKTYGDLLGGERFDPENPEHLVYAQALNMENYLYLAVLGFGVTTLALATGAFMIIVGLALGGIGVYILRQI